MPERRGGGDFEPNKVVGRWAGDRIAFIGDYSEHEDLPDEFDAEMIYDYCQDGTYTDITDMVCEVLEKELDGKFEGDGWRNFVHNKPDITE